MFGDFFLLTDERYIGDIYSKLSLPLVELRGKDNRRRYIEEDIFRCCLENSFF
jgi:hypothetical protein